MTPRELCDLAKRINAVEPGLVKDFRPIARSDDPASTKETRVVDHFTSRTYIMDDAAAMMTGRCATWMEENMHDLMGPTRQTIVGAYRTLREYVAATLPGAKQ